jgi:hypothetical protein
VQKHIEAKKVRQNNSEGDVRPMCFTEAETFEAEIMFCPEIRIVFVNWEALISVGWVGGTFLVNCFD